MIKFYFLILIQFSASLIHWLIEISCGLNLKQIFEDSDNSFISSFESIELRVFLSIFLLELNEIRRSLSIYFSRLISNLKSFLIGSKTTKEEKTFGGGLNDEGGTSHILFIFDKSCILILSAPALGLPLSLIHISEPTRPY